MYPQEDSVYLQENIVYPTEDEWPAINVAFDGFFQAVQTKETDKRTAMFSRPKKSRDILFGTDNPIVRPTREQEKTLRQLQDQLSGESESAQVSPAGIAEITLQAVPDAYRDFTKAVERQSGLRVQFVRAEGLRREIACLVADSLQCEIAPILPLVPGRLSRRIGSIRAADVSPKLTFASS